MDETELLKKRFGELAEECYARGRYTFSDFLSLAEQDAFFGMEREVSYASPALFGGVEGCERRMLRFGSAEILGYEEGYPIVCLRLSPAVPKFADELSHRDILGALMNLGIKRTVLGDIVLREKEAFVFCHEKIAPFLLEHLTKAKHTELRVSRCETLPEGALFQTREKRVQCASDRLDAVIAGCYGLSRSEAKELIEAGRLFLGGKCCQDPARSCAEGEVVSLRGYGKFLFRGTESLSRKGKLNLLLEEYV